ncbi:uncharacterized protein J4E84_007931 [Alternaria hordeiaustralica]|uniref:uncharacterized protein n=1 Tax=Alternaria hordeiaustralica TaxID=1187925 RepID=UPI0020C41229|nr:uncharacterized protein J4E84_007931 [Alternaria hordeiaustralica]KAI4680283.1 hypothetical protein J4E84_007931 [Alternaria hordeiaustralica]
MPNHRFKASDIRRYLIDTAQHEERNDDCEDEESSSVSPTSTVEHDQESFEFFSTRVMELCAAQFPRSSFQVERLRGGTYNRITAITVTPLPPRAFTFPWIRSLLPINEAHIKAYEPKHYILRSARREPSSDDLDMRYDVATLKFARMKFRKYVPRVIHLDEHTRNPLSRTYIIQNRLPGQNLNRIWLGFSIKQKISTMHIVVRVMKRLHNIQGPKAGIIARLRVLLLSRGEVIPEICAFRTTKGPVSAFAGHVDRPAEAIATRQFLLHRSRRWQRLEQDQEDGDEVIWDCFDIITRSLHDMGLIPDSDRFYFCHLDLYPRNMLVEIEDDSSLLLTGLLDWDAQFAHFCPKFVAYRAPFWLWVWGGHEYDEMISADEPTNADHRRLKTLWEEEASDEWKRYAYEPEYMIARRMFALLRDGIRHDGDKEEARSIVDEWQKLHYDQRLAAAYADDESDGVEASMDVGNRDEGIYTLAQQDLELDDVRDEDDGAIDSHD